MKNKNYRPKQRTKKQNNSIHRYCELLADALNDGGFSVQLVLAQKMDIDWNKDLVKTLLWHPAQYAILKKKSTTELSKLEDIDKVYDHLNRHISKTFWVYVPFPHNAELEGMIKTEDTPYLDELN